MQPRIVWCLPIAAIDEDKFTTFRSKVVVLAAKEAEEEEDNKVNLQSFDWDRAGEWHKVLRHASY